MESKVVQISTTQDDENMTVIIALCEDGSLWSARYLDGGQGEHNPTRWNSIDLLPKQPEQ